MQNYDDNVEYKEQYFIMLRASEKANRATEEARSASQEASRVNEEAICANEKAIRTNKEAISANKEAIRANEEASHTLIIAQRACEDMYIEAGELPPPIARTDAKNTSENHEG